MSGSGSSAFLDLLRVLSPAGTPQWALIAGAALFSVAVAAILVAVVAKLGAWAERKAGVQAAGAGGSRPTDRAGPWIWVGTLGALAVFPWAPHVFFADLQLGAFAAIVLLSLVAVGRASA